MIKIIVKGTRKELTCKSCGCLFSYEAEDIKFEDKPSVVGGMHREDYIECPQCENKIVLKATR